MDGTEKLCKKLYGKENVDKMLGGSDAPMLHDAVAKIEELEQRLETASAVDTIVSGWIEIEGNEVFYNQVCTDDTMIKFDDGSECRYADDWPFAAATHFKLKGSH